MVPDDHELVLAHTPELMTFLESADFKNDLVPKLKSQYVVEVQVKEDENEKTEEGGPTITL